MKNTIPMASSFGGFRIIESAWLTVPRAVTVNRTWRERLASSPWRPWVRTRVVCIQAPSPEVLRMGDTLVIHPETLKVLQTQLDHESIRSRP